MFENATLLTSDYLINELGYTIDGGSSFQRAKFKDYYIDTCSFINENHFAKPSMSNIEEYLSVGAVNIGKTFIKSNIANENERKDLFKRAMGKQLIYDMLNGRASMFRGEKDGICLDMVKLVKMLGLFKRTPFVI